MKKYIPIFLTLMIYVLTCGVPRAKAETAYGITSMAVDTGTEISSFSYAQSSDGNYNRIASSASGVDVTYTFDDVALNSANIIYVNFDGSVCSISTNCASASFPYQLQIRDFTNSTWRNLVPHDTNLTNTADSATGLLTQFTAGVNSGGQFLVYNGFFTDGANTPISTPLTNFVNGSNQMQIRVYSSTSTANMELRMDYLSVEPAIDNQLYSTSKTMTNGTVGSNEYNDLTTDDNTTNMTLTAGGSGLDMYYSFATAPTPYTGANTILVEYSGSDDASIASYRIYIRDFTNNQWDQLNGTNLNSASDTTYYFSTGTSQAVTDYISGGEIRIRLESASTSGTVTVDYLRATIGSVATNAGFYTGTISRGSTSTGTVVNTQTIDTTTADSAWVLSTSTTDARTTNEFTSDCATATNSCAAVNIQVPVTLPSNVQVTGLHTMFRLNTSVATVGYEMGVRSKRIGNIPVTASYATAAAANFVRTLASPLPPQPGSAPLTTIGMYQPNEYVNTVDNAINLYVRTSVNSVATAQTMTLDYAFASIRYIGPNISKTAAWSSNNAGTVTTGTTTTSNGRMAMADDNTNWVIAPAANVVDAYASITNVTAPSGSNKLIVTVQMSCSAANGTYEIYLRDFTNATWLDMSPHAGNFTCATTEAYHQFEIFDGYFSDGGGTPLSTPLSNFVSGSEIRVRVLSSSTANMQIDYIMTELAKDPVYFPANDVPINGSATSNEYNDLYSDDNSSNMVFTNSGGINFYYEFNNVITPPTGSNAAFLALSAFHTGATSYNVYLYNFNSASWEQLNGTALTNTTDATNYFLKNISTWSNYISNNQMRVRLASTVAAGTITIDYVKLILGSVTTNGNQLIDLGDTYYNDYTKSTDLDTSTTYVKTTHAWGIRAWPNNQTARTYGAPAAIATRIKFPLTQPTNSYPLALIWNWRGSNSANSTLTPVVSFEESKNYFSDAGTSAAPNAYIPFTSASVPPTAIPVTSLATSTQTTREGWYQTNILSTSINSNMPNVQQAIDNTNNVITSRIRTSASTTLTAPVLDLDSMFVALRYVN